MAGKRKKVKEEKTANMKGRSGFTPSISLFRGERKACEKKGHINLRRKKQQKEGLKKKEEERGRKIWEALY